MPADESQGSQHQESETRERVLESAVAVFAEKGFRDATIHEICERARANIAAVNYYFGSKENLYAEAWRAAFRRTLEAHPRDGGAPEDASPEERLRGRIRSVIGAMTDPSDQSFLIMQKEMANPTNLLHEVQRECIGPIRRETAALVRELLGDRVSEQHARFCEASIMGQCLGMAHWMRAHRDGRAPHGAPFSAGDADAFAEHVVQFSLAGLRAVRERAVREGDRTMNRTSGDGAQPHPAPDGRGAMQ